MLTLEQQALLITNQLNDVVDELREYTKDEKYDIQFLAVDTLQSINKYKRIDDKKYIPIILTRVEPDIPFTQYGSVTDYLYLTLYFDAADRGVVEEIVESYRQSNTAKNIYVDESQITQYIGKLVTQETERPQDGTNIRKLSASLRINWLIQGAGILSDSVVIKIDGEVVNAKIATYRNDKASAPTKPFGTGYESTYMVSEQLALTIPLTPEFQTTQL